jgi:hypothetical protein
MLGAADPSGSLFQREQTAMTDDDTAGAPPAPPACALSGAPEGDLAGKPRRRKEPNQQSRRQATRSSSPARLQERTAEAGQPGPALPEESDVLLLGVPRGRSRPVGARFAAREAGVARWLARHHGLQVVAADTEAARALAPRVAPWRLRPDGTPVLDTLTVAAWEALRSLLPPAGPPDPAPAAEPERGEAEAAERTARAEALWAAIGVGDAVLAPELGKDGEPDGWWEAVVLALEGEVATVAWRDHPEGGLLRRQRAELALRHPMR